MVNTAVGEIAIHDSGADYILRPSFFALSQIEDLDGTTKAACYALAAIETGKMPRPLDLLDCAAVIHACGLPDERSDITGQLEPSKNTGTRWKPGKMGVHNLVIIANSLISAGIVGKVKKRRRKTKSASKSYTFNPAEFAASAVAHFSMPPDQAWALTMTEFQLIMDAKYPPDDKDRPEPMTESEVLAAFARTGVQLQS